MCVVYNTPMNTVGVGDPMPFGGIAGLGSGDRFDGGFSKKAYKQYKPYMKKPAQMPFNFSQPLPLLVMTKQKPKIKTKTKNKK